MDANDLLLGSVGGKAAKFTNISDTITGTLIAAPESRQQTVFGTQKPKFNEDSGKPEMEVVIKLQTQLRDPSDANDDGIRTLYARGTMLRAIGKAMVDSGARQLEIGGSLAVQYTGDLPSRTPGFKDAKLFAAKYAPPAPQASQILAQAASEPVYTGQQPANGGVVFENQHREQDRTQRPMTTLEQMRQASYNPHNAPGQPPF